ncbi:MAG: GNAT family N-acetyltransferase, partial [Clostridia bacterium]|nr:GNAT family N-acetyltransferase [Clostridia bacterium]
QGLIDCPDEIDKRAAHLVLFEGDMPIAVCRVFEEEGRWMLGRFAVLKEHRGKGAGRALLAFAEEYVREQKGRELTLHSQLDAKGFYSRLGYEEYGEIEYEQGCAHIWMKKKV